MHLGGATRRVMIALISRVCQMSWQGIGEAVDWMAMPLDEAD